MPRLIEFDAAIAKRIEGAVDRILRGVPRAQELKVRQSKGKLKLNYATVALESNVSRHLFDDPNGIYPEQYALIFEKMPKRGQVEPLAKQLDRLRTELTDIRQQLERSHTYAAHLLTNSHLLELENARLKEEIQGPGRSGDTVVGTGELIGLPPPQPRRPPPKSAAFGKGRKRA